MPNKRCLIVGADAIGRKENYLAVRFGADEVLHWDGRGKKFPPFLMVNMVIVLTGFINHGMMQHVKKEAKKRSVQVVYLKRGIAELEQTA